ncbi:GH3 domain-containing protein-like isoform X2 [Patiria miniata]|uniref:GH3 domain-containing protein n=1 Tax=Patiria miniata TaxID=46514 RepID=A0A914A3N4_PATMI|nr:GH3 domain-containing protein-like isoform X1 [Patiria miniata]XP_038058280.1 GH3 domain-containing protein-like isoform X2 [Patiria miniata]
MAVTWEHRCVLWALASAGFTAYVINAYFINDATWLCRVAAGFLAILGTLSSVTAFHISTLRCSESHTLKTLLLQYILFQVATLATPFSLYKLKKLWKEPRKAQEKFLLKLISRDADTEYGRRYLTGIQSLQDFRDKHPLTKYDHYQDYFQRLADGEKNVCVAAKVDRFGISSGTTGKGKLIPMVFNDSGLGLVVVLQAVGSSPIQKMAGLYCKPAQKFTKSGLPIAPAVFVPDNSSLAKFMVSTLLNSPFSAFQISTDFEATYVHLLFALTDKNVCTFSAPFASQVYRAFSMLEDEQDMFLEDLSTGRINPRLNIDAETRRSLDAALEANPARAHELRAEFARGFVGILGRIWPHLNCFVTADISGYVQKLKAKYTKGSRLYSFAYGCTEGLVCYNLWMDGRPPQYVLSPSTNLTEFIPEDLSEEANPKTLFLDEIEVGKRYEIVITTVSGFYRYRMGDVVEVVGFHDNCPVIQVKYRTGELLNLRSEKIDKLVVNNAIQESLTSWQGATLVEWTCAESPLMYGDAEHVDFDMLYLLFIELESVDGFRLSEEQKSLFDQSLRKQHEFYDHYRQVGTICEARVMIVRPGSFKKLQDFIIATSTASYNLFKMPKKLRTKATLDLMMKCVVDV